MSNLQIILNRIDKVDSERIAAYRNWQRTGNMIYKAQAETAKIRLAGLERTALQIKMGH